MPKSRNRKDHKKKSRNRTITILKRKEKAQKDFLEMIKKAQETQLAKQKEAAEKDTTTVVEGMDIGDIDQIKTETEVGVADGNIDIDNIVPENK